MPSSGKVRWDHGGGGRDRWKTLLLDTRGEQRVQHPRKPSTRLRMRIWDLAGAEDRVTPCSLEGKGELWSKVQVAVNTSCDTHLGSHFTEAKARLQLLLAPNIC